MILTNLTAVAAVTCMLIPQPVERRAKDYKDFVASCASNATRQEYGRDTTGGMVVTAAKDADGNWIALRCDFPRPKPKPRKPTDAYLEVAQEVVFCRNVDGVAQIVPRP